MVLTPKQNKTRIAPYLTHNAHRKLIAMCSASDRTISDVVEYLINEGHAEWSKPLKKVTENETL